MQVGSRGWWPLTDPRWFRCRLPKNRLWFNRQVSGALTGLQLGVALQLRGRLDADALRAALADVVGRHESLRTIFPDIDGVPLQQVVPTERADFGWEIVDATGWPAVG